MVESLFKVRIQGFEWQRGRVIKTKHLNSQIPNLFLVVHYCEHDSQGELDYIKIHPIHTKYYFGLKIINNS